MITNDLTTLTVPSEIKRAINNEEREHLNYLLKRAVSPRKRYLKAILNVFVLWGFSLLALLMISGIFSYLAQYSQFISSLVKFSGLQTLAIIGSACFALLLTNRWLKNWENPYPLILQDLSAGQMHDETHLVQDICRFQEPELGGFIYFLKVSEDKVFIIYDYDSQNKAENSHDKLENALVIRNTLTLNKAPCSGYYLNHHCSGKILPILNTYPLNLAPESWPLSHTWSARSWSQLKQHLG